ncbi:AP2/B3-like transcriptional factor family protein [Striga asiatica]|uniref:AP2/B3-like transcriptional factor family protein n=1 Tax=Striga asiatica TaxID=4170 RepID=A0A5A7Q1S2_STRAF|nr:AP2/B3-like transcriptional factor family protein [Striga asiatica]
MLTYQILHRHIFIADFTLRLHNDKGNTWIVVAGLYAGSAIFQEGWGRFLHDNGLNEGDTIFFDHIALHIFNVLILDDKGNIKSAPAKGDLPLYASRKDFMT